VDDIADGYISIINYITGSESEMPNLKNEKFSKISGLFDETNFYFSKIEKTLKTARDAVLNKKIGFLLILGGEPTVLIKGIF